MTINGALHGSQKTETISGVCASIVALVVALDEAAVIRRTRYEEILKKLWTELPDEEADGEAGAHIERVLDLVRNHASRQIASSFHPERIRRSPACDDAADSHVDDGQSDSESQRNGRRTRHAPLLGGPFVV